MEAILIRPAAKGDTGMEAILIQPAAKGDTGMEAILIQPAAKGNYIMCNGCHTQQLTEIGSSFPIHSNEASDLFIFKVFFSSSDWIIT